MFTGTPEQRILDVIKHQPITFGRIVDIAFDEEALVPIGVGILECEEWREEIDELMTIGFAEIAPDRALAAIAVVQFKLRRPG